MKSYFSLGGSYEVSKLTVPTSRGKRLAILKSTSSSNSEFITSSNFQDTDNSFISKKINLGLDLQGGSYLLLEIDNGPVEIQKLQNTTTVIRNFLKSKNINFNDLRIQDNRIIFNVSKNNSELVQSFFLDKESEINPYYNQYKSHEFVNAILLYKWFLMECGLWYNSIALMSEWE